eukprot:CAMPEP_0167776360 /NCGR_PEP_ID=MMETSP0111_2-20121227/3080_1 /TAXON_ID=91324 /ORGANISM="Lotharella globosa, Strain CCCM811" /LENGTH=655 /DNA_ID=CAMNT_0007666395 /DNA_START=194 /DNA_END=2162 /DNA_ORIENTATION=+
MKSLRNVAPQMLNKPQLHFLLGIQYLRIGHSPLAQEHLKLALDGYMSQSPQNCDKKWRRFVETKMKLAYAQSLYDFTTTGRAAAPGTGRAATSTSNDGPSGEKKATGRSGGDSGDDSEATADEAPEPSGDAAAAAAGVGTWEDRRFCRIGGAKSHRGGEVHNDKAGKGGEYARRLLEPPRPAAVRRGKPTTGKDGLQQFVNSFPGCNELENNLGFLRIVSDNMEKARQNFQDILRRNENHMEALNNYAAVLIYKGKYSEAIIPLNHGLNQVKSVPHMWNALAIAYMMEGKHNYAWHCFLKARDNEQCFSGSAWSTRFTMANCLRRMSAREPSIERKRKFLQGAENFLNTVAKLEETSDVHVALGLVHSARPQATDEDRKKTLDCLIKALRMDRTNKHAWNTLGLEFIRGARCDKAINYFLEAVHLDRKEPALWINLGIAYHLAGRFQDAETVLKKALELDANNIQAMNNLANMYKATNRVDKAKALYIKCIRILSQTLNPSEPSSKQTQTLIAQANNNLALVYIRQRQLENAMEHLLIAQRHDPKLQCVQDNIARLHALRLRLGAGATTPNSKRSLDEKHLQQQKLQQSNGPQPMEESSLASAPRAHIVPMASAVLATPLAATAVPVVEPVVVPRGVESQSRSEGQTTTPESLLR